MDPLTASILVINILLEGIDLIGAYDRVAHGIAAKAEAEGRDVTPEESDLIRGLRDAAAKRRRGE